MNRSIRILHLEDDARDAELIRQKLKAAGLSCEIVWASGRDPFESTLEREAFDLVLIDYNLPDYDGMSALRRLREKQPEVPVIVISGTLGEEAAVECLKAGAIDYVLKQRPQRLGAAVNRALQEAEQHKRRRQAEEALRESEVRFRTLTEVAPVGIFRTDAAGHCEFVNDRWCEIAGMSLEQALGAGWATAIYHEDRQRVFEEWYRAAQERKPFHFEYRFQRPDGWITWVVGQARAEVGRHNEVMGYVGTITDLTVIKLAEAAVRESEARLRLTIDTALDAVVTMDAQGLICDWNAQAEAIFGWKREEAIGAPMAELIIPPQYREAHARGLRHVLVTGEGPLLNRRIEIMALRRDGQEFPIELSIAPMTVKGAWIFSGFARDITERKRAEEALRKSETHLRAIIETEPECVKIVSGDGKLLEMNQAGLVMLQASSLAEAQQQSLLEFIAAEHRAAFGGLHKRVMNGESGKLEFEVIGLKGARRWLETSAAPLRSAAGEVQQMLGITRDITERKQSEQRLRESEAKFRQLIEQAADGIFLSDAEGNFVLVNSRGCELLGYTENELLGMNGKVTYLEEEREIHTKRMQEVRIGQILRFERMIKRKDGSTFPAEISLKMLDTGLVQVIFHDITTRRTHEQKIARLSRIQTVSSGINSAIVRIRDRQELFEEACRIAVTHGGFRMVWIGLADKTAKKVKPVTWAGFEDGFLSRVARLSFDEDPFEGQGVTGRAIRSKAPVVTNDFATAPHIVFKEETLQRGYRSGAVLPLLVGTEAVGVISLYAPEPGFFDDEELKLLFELAGDISFALEYMEKETKLNYLANYDALTGLSNRSLFSERLSQQLHTRADSPELVAVALMDVEHFRMVNDTLDRQAGDELLRLIALRLESNATMTRFSNPARLAADCFAVIIRGARDSIDLVRLLEAGMKACFGVPFVINGQELRIVARAGVSAYPTDGSTAESLLKNAETALRNAKRTTERFVFYAPEMNARVAEILALETKLRKAIELEQFVLHYQPKFDIATGKVTGVEALIRWNDPDTGLVPPARFIPILEETGMIFEVGRWALQQAVRDQQGWCPQGLPVLRVAVNVSAQQLRDRNFVRDVRFALESEEGLKPALELEITESLLMDDIERNIERLKTLRDLGVTIAIDDFGTGYSSLNYLARLPVDALKIDRSFVAGMSASPENWTIVSTIISLAHSLGLKVVAEGVETDEQLNLLRLLKCDELQGFLLSRPLPRDEVASFLRR